MATYKFMIMGTVPYAPSIAFAPLSRHQYPRHPATMKIQLGMRIAMRKVAVKTSTNMLLARCFAPPVMWTAPAMIPWASKKAKAGIDA